MALSAFLNRQMEYDADRWEALLSGGTVFAETALKFRILEVSSWRAMTIWCVPQGRLATTCRV
ncbi:MAG: hypothetical protein IPL89_08915 [Acidobacteria bacterium]|nr:hypothetical protein [Acidobacteriota bacterium]